MRLTFSWSRLWWLIDVNESRSSKIVMTRTNSAHVLLRRMRATVKANITVDSRSPTDRSQCRPRQLLLIDLVEIEQQLHVDSVDSNAATYQPRSRSNHRLMLFTSAPPRDIVAHETAFAWGMLVAASGQVRRFGTGILTARSWGSSRRNPGKQTLASPTSAIGGIAGRDGR